MERIFGGNAMIDISSLPCRQQRVMWPRLVQLTVYIIAADWQACAELSTDLQKCDHRALGAADYSEGLTIGKGVFLRE